jgi:hypothetical protein
MWLRLPEDLPVLTKTLHAIGVARLHFHHVHGLPASILELPVASGLPYDCTLHDYYAICPQYHLADVDGRYCGEPDAAGCVRRILAEREFSGELQRLLSELGATLGRFDLPGQLRGLDGAIRSAEESLRRVREGAPERRRSYQILGLCTGAAMAILLL